MTPRLPGNTRQACLFSVIALFLLCPHAVHAGSPRRAAGTPPSQESESNPEGRSLKRPGGIKRFGRNVLELLWCGPSNRRIRWELLEYGPQFPDRYDPSDFSFWALVNTNWPMAVEYEMESQGTAVITINVMGAAPFTQTFTGEGIGKRQTGRFILPVYTGKGPHAALITLKATRPGPKGNERASFLFFGAGAGEEAVASHPTEPNGLEVAALGPLPPGVGRLVREPPGRQFSSLRLFDVTFGPGQGGYVFTFRVSGIFNRWGADITRMIQTRSHHEPEKVATAALKAQPIGPRYPVGGVWNGLGKNRRRVRRGEYSVHVMVWVSSENRGDWDYAVFGDPLTIN